MYKIKWTILGDQFRKFWIIPYAVCTKIKSVPESIGMAPSRKFPSQAPLLISITTDEFCQFLEFVEVELYVLFF